MQGSHGFSFAMLLLFSTWQLFKQFGFQWFLRLQENASGVWMIKLEQEQELGNGNSELEEWKLYLRGVFFLESDTVAFWKKRNREDWTFHHFQAGLMVHWFALCGLFACFWRSPGFLPQSRVMRIRLAKESKWPLAVKEQCDRLKACLGSIHASYLLPTSANFSIVLLAF